MSDQSYRERVNVEQEARWLDRQTESVRVDEQRTSALVEANRRRSGAADLKREVAAGLPLVEAIRDPRAAVIRVDVLLGCVPGLGPVKVARVLRRVSVSPAARVRDVTVRQADALAGDGLVAGGRERDYDRARYVNRRAA